MPVSDSPMPTKPQPSRDREPDGIAAGDAGATSMAEKVARKAPRMQPHEKAQLGADASRDEDA